MTAESRDQFPPGYYARIHLVERDHWWYRGMRDLSAALLGPWLAKGNQDLLDAGCGTGGFLRWALDTGAFRSATGIDIAPEAIALASADAPDADLRVGSVLALPHPDCSFDVVVLNDVLQHLPHDDAVPALAELARVTRPGGAVLVRTRGSRRPDPSYHAYDRALLAATIERAGLSPQTVTFANLGGSLLAAARRRAPKVLERERGEGIPRPVPTPKTLIASRLMAIERQLLLRRAPFAVPWGHTIMALAVAREC
ncbi:MAG TPA: class I SAM-dependent methyltransferase [Thermoleophilaceae bacterium]|nr:class I SAM-dependent methyltransferase [Thermoleophilaceae bacterium]